jgi:WD40 domain-containing protein
MSHRSSGDGARQRADELRAAFLANRERVRSWVADWYIPEVAWPEVPLVPSPWVVPERDRQRWLEEYVPYLPDYRWSLDAAPRYDGITRVSGSWWFGQGHELDRLEIRTTTVTDPQYLAEKLALGVDAAALHGWSEGDAQPVYEWLLELIGTRPLNHGVRAKNRIGHVLVEATRLRHSRTECDMQVVVTETYTAIDGSPLDESGRPIPRPDPAAAEGVDVHAVYRRGLARWRAGEITHRQLLAELEALRPLRDDQTVDYLLASVHLERGDMATAARVFGAAAPPAPVDPDGLVALMRARGVDAVPLEGDTYLGRGAFSADGRTAVTVLEGRDLGVWATGTGRRRCTLTGHGADVRTVALSADGRVLVSGDEAGHVRVWDTRESSCVQVWHVPVPPGCLTSVAVSGDGLVQVMAANDGSVRVRDGGAEHGLRVLHEASEDYDLLHDVTATLTADDRLVCVFDQYHWQLRVWDLDTGRFRGAMQLNRQFAFSAGGAVALAVTEDERVQVVDLRRQAVDEVGSAAGWGRGWIAVTDDGRRGFDADGSELRIWDLDGNRCSRTVDLGIPDPFFTINGDGSLTLVAHDRRTVFLVSLR